MFGKLIFKSALYRWASTLSGSLSAGVQAANALEMASDAANSAWIESLTPGMVDAVRAGRSIGSEMALNPDVFPVNIRTMVSTGEATGDLTSMLDSVTTVLQEEIDAQVEGLSAKIEVLLLLVLGGGDLLALLPELFQLRPPFFDIHFRHSKSFALHKAVVSFTNCTPPVTPAADRPLVTYLSCC